MSLSSSTSVGVGGRRALPAYSDGFLSFLMDLTYEALHQRVRGKTALALLDGLMLVCLFRLDGGRAETALGVQQMHETVGLLTGLVKFPSVEE